MRRKYVLLVIVPMTAVMYLLNRIVIIRFEPWTKLMPHKSKLTIAFENKTMEMDLLINEQDTCKPINGKAVTLLITVHSAPAYYEKRQAIRQTWGSIVKQNHSMKLLFLVGFAPNDTNIEAESREFQDIIQFGFLDTYQNLTLKSLCLLTWISTYCSNVPLLLKSDDDMYINVNNFISLASSLPKQNLVFGLIFKKAKPVRDPLHKFYVPKSMYTYDEYPDYARGTAYGMVGNVVDALMEGCRSQKFLNMEDVFITGLCALNVDVNLLKAPGFNHFKLKTEFPCMYRDIVAGHQVEPCEMRFIHKVINHPTICG